jgi:hypothetical protein
MTSEQLALLAAAKHALIYIESRYGRHDPPKGMYNDLTIARLLANAIADVEASDPTALLSEQVPS